jgi:two-component sensor histidine kinase
MVCCRYRLSFSNHSAWVCRDLVRLTLHRLEPERVDAAVIVADELVTNALKHGAPPVVLSVEHDRDGIVASVSDRGKGLPAMKIPELTADHGRGMWVIDQLSEAWGVEEMVVGKRIWSRLRLQPSAGGVVEDESRVVQTSPR